MHCSLPQMTDSSRQRRAFPQLSKHCFTPRFESHCAYESPVSASIFPRTRPSQASVASSVQRPEIEQNASIES